MSFMSFTRIPIVQLSDNFFLRKIDFQVACAYVCACVNGNRKERQTLCVIDVGCVPGLQRDECCDTQRPPLPQGHRTGAMGGRRKSTNQAPPRFFSSATRKTVLD